MRSTVVTSSRFPVAGCRYASRGDSFHSDRLLLFVTQATNANKIAEKIHSTFIFSVIASLQIYRSSLYVLIFAFVNKQRT